MNTGLFLVILTCVVALTFDFINGFHDAANSIATVVPRSRLTWHYFWTRCWSEGLSKAVVSHLVGSGSGLAAERQHVLGAIPREFGRSLWSLRTRPRTYATRMALLVAGTTCAAVGFFWGRFVVRQSPIAFSADDFSLLTKVVQRDGWS